MSDALTVQGLTKRYGAHPVLQGLNLSLPAGALGLFLGPNGAGKTTTLRLLAGLEAPDSGTFTLLGRAPHPALRREVAFTLEEPRFYPHLSLLDNLRVVAGYRGLRRAGVWAAGALERVGLQASAHRAFGRCSLGMRQRLYLASTLTPDLRRLLLDEPTNGLDVEGREALWAVLTRLRADGVSLLVSTHQVLEAERSADHLSVLHGGRSVFDGPLSALQAQRRLVLQVPDPAQTALALESHGHATESGRGAGEVVVQAAPAQAAQVLGLLSTLNLPVYGSRPEDLEELYWRIKDAS
ncbi:ABC transporter ATP-binding protein [Deinococcus aquaedulcis]|uniref:ABC transporter ATP-binding protein n=1 Tax=Deinococcus aquaedulcis TaxID=2840455 RepID=UPI001C82EC46|nr:ABC transporter ATP-binding protein [Deinococcus aquaedulcis]